MSSASSGRGGVSWATIVLVAGLVLGGGWLWYESLPKQVAEIAAKPEEGPVRMRLLDGAATSVDPDAPPPSGGIGSEMIRAKEQEARAAIEKEAAGGDAAKESSDGDTPAPAEEGTSSPAAESVEPARPEAAGAGRWEEDVAAFEAADRDAPRPAGGVLFLGASNVRLWETLEEDFSGIDVVNRGVGGCRLSELADVAPRLARGVRPAVIVVSAGSNDIHAGATPEEVAVAFRRLRTALLPDLPNVPLVCLAILPAASRWGERSAQVRANELLAAAAGALTLPGAPVEFHDVGSGFLGADGRPDPEAFLDDDLHPSALGNARRAARLRPVLERLLAVGAHPA